MLFSFVTGTLESVLEMEWKVTGKNCFPCLTPKIWTYQL